MRSPALALAVMSALALAQPLDPFALPEGARIEIGDLALEEWLDLPVSSVSLREQPASEAPAAVFALSGDAVRLQGLTTLDAVLRTVPGLFATYDSAYGNLGVRGLSLPGDQNTRVLVLVDGHPVNDGLGIGQSYLMRDLPVNVQAVERIEVIQGPIGGVYGPTAFAATINIVTKSSTSPRLEAQLGGEAHLPRPSGAELSATWSARLLDRVDVLATAGLYHSAGEAFSYPELSLLSDRRIPHDATLLGTDGTTAANAYLRLSVDGVTVQAGFSHRLKGLPTAAYGALIGDSRLAYANTRAFAVVTVDKEVARSFRVLGRLSVDHVGYADTIPYDVTADVPGDWVDAARDTWLSAELRLTWTPVRALRLMVGSSAQYHWTDQKFGYVGEQHHAPVNYFTITGYALADVTLFDKLMLQAGTTWHRHQLFGQRLTPRFAGVLKVTADTTVKALLSGGFRSPTLFEMYYVDGSYFLPSRELRVDEALSVELTIEQRLGRSARASLTLFNTDWRYLIRQHTVMVAEPPTSSFDYLSDYENLPPFSVFGAQASLNINLHERLRAWGGVSVQHAVLPNEQLLPGFAPVTANLSVSTNWPWRPLTVAATSFFLAPRAKDPVGLQFGQRALVPAGVGLGFSLTLRVPSYEALALQLSVHNLLAATLYHPVMGDYAPITEYREPGPIGRLSLTWTY